MRLNTRVLGPIVAAVLALSASGAVMAQPTDIQPVGVTLVDAEPNPLCAVDLSIRKGDFGTWEWDGTSYIPASGYTAMALTVTFLGLPPAACDVNVGFAGLTDAAGAHHIDTSHFVAYTAETGVDHDPAAWSEPAVPPPGFEFVYRLADVPDDLPAGTYTGEIQVEVTDAV